MILPFASIKEQFYNQYLDPILQPVYKVAAYLYISPFVVVGVPTIALIVFAIKRNINDENYRKYNGVYIIGLILVVLGTVYEQVLYIHQRLGM